MSGDLFDEWVARQEAELGARGGLFMLATRFRSFSPRRAWLVAHSFDSIADLAQYDPEGIPPTVKRVTGQPLGAARESVRGLVETARNYTARPREQQPKEATLWDSLNPST